MMRFFSSLVLLCSIYMVTVIIGLNTAAYILPLMYPPSGVERSMEPVVASPQDVSSALWIFGYILVATAVMLILIKRKWDLIINAALFLSFFSGMLFSFEGLFGGWGIFFTIVLLALFLWRSNDLLISNLVLVFTLSGVGAVLGASLGMIPVIALIVLLAVYDWVSVYVTKHMVTLAKESKGRFNMMFLVPVGDRAMGLGAGDIALPVTFAVSVFSSHGAGYAIATAYGGLSGLVWVFLYIMGKKNVTLPALPPITLGLIAGYSICRLILG